MIMGEIEVKAKIAKADISKMVAYRGVCNRVALTLNDATYEPGTVVFSGFEGSLDIKDGLYHGSLVFRLVQPSDSERDLHDLNEIPGMGSDVKPEPRRATRRTRRTEAK